METQTQQQKQPTRPLTTKIILVDEEIEVSIFKVICYWKEPKFKEKESYVFTLKMILRKLNQKGIIFDNYLDAIRIFVRMYKDKCKRLFVYDNTPGIHTQLIGYFENGNWQRLSNEKSGFIKS